MKEKLRIESSAKTMHRIHKYFTEIYFDPEPEHSQNQRLQNNVHDTI